MKLSSVLAATGIFVVIGSAAGGLAWYKHQRDHKNDGMPKGHEPAEAVQLLKAREIHWQPMSDLVGTVLSLRSIVVSNELAGTIRELKFDSGAIVEAGQVLVVFDDATDRADLLAAQASVRVAQASVSVADARLKLAHSELGRWEEAVQLKASSEMDLDRSKAELDRATADRERLIAEVDLAKAKVDQVQSRLDKRVIKAPFRARVGLRTVHEGQYLVDGSQVVSLQEVSDKIYLDFAIPQEYLARVKPGMSVMATGAVFGPEPVKIDVVAIDASVNNETRNVRVRSIVDNKNGLLRQGMFVQVSVPVEAPSPRVVIPNTSLRRSSYGDQVFVVVAAEAPGMYRAKQRFVKLGPTVGEDVIVLEGVKAGDELATVGSFKLHDGAQVRSVEAAKK